MEQHPNFPLVIRINPSASILTDVLLCLLTQRHKEPKEDSGSLNFDFNGITVLFPGGSIPPFGATTSRPTQHKVTMTGSKNFASGALGIIVSGAIPVSTP